MHPKFKMKNRVTNWSQYDRTLVQRGNITLWISAGAIKPWTPESSGRRGAPHKYSDLVIESGLTLRLIYGLLLRQAGGGLRSLLRSMELHLDAPDHITISRRSR